MIVESKNIECKKNLCIASLHDRTDRANLTINRNVLSVVSNGSILFTTLPLYFVLKIVLTRSHNFFDVKKISDLFEGLALRGNIVYVLGLRFLLVMVLFSVCRVGFYFFNIDYFSSLSLNTFVSILAGGIRFDLAALLYTNMLFILMMLIPFRFRFYNQYQNVAKWIFFITNGVALAMNVSDFVYFKFTGRRTTADVLQQFENEKNLGGLFGQFLFDYWYAVVFWIALIVIMVWFYNRIKLRGPLLKNKVVFYVSGVLVLMLCIYLFIGGARGGFRHSTRPITLSDAGKYVDDPKDVSLVLNTPFAFYRTLGKTKIRKVHYFETEEKLNAVYSPLRHTTDTATMKKLNVVLIILESFSKEFVGYFNTSREQGTYKGHTPFLDSLLQHSKSFQHSFSSGRKSIDALPSIIASVPSMGVPYVLSPYSGNRINSLGTLLKPEGYHTSFFHGAPNGSMGFDSFMNIASMDHYYGMSEYGNNNDFDGMWGIWDEKFLNFMAQTQKDFPEPFLSAFFSVSSHHPFEIPEEYEHQFKGGREPILKCVEYTDDALRKYFKKVSTYPWFKNTLFVFTADHVSSNVLFEDSRTGYGLFSIPIFFYRPDNSLAGVDSTIIHQVDIMPTVLQYLGYNKPYLSFGSNAFNATSDRFAWNYKDDVYQFYQRDYLLQFDGKRSLALYNFKVDKLLRSNIIVQHPEVVKSLEPTIKAIIQQYNNRMVDNNLTIK